MEFELKIESNNAAFSENPELEVARIIRDVAAKLEIGRDEGYVTDVNGNKVGGWYLIKEDE